MAPDLTPVTLFEGIATLSMVEGVEHDAYMTVRTEAVGQTIRWFGSFGWLGEYPYRLLVPIVANVVLSDGRECQVKITKPADESGQLEFLGLGLPPGFEPLPSEIEVFSAELRSTTPSVWRVWLSRLLGLVSIVAIFTAIWVEDYRWQLILSGMLSMFLAIGFTPTPPKPLPEVPHDCPHQ